MYSQVERQSTVKNPNIRSSFCIRNFKKYLLETTLHGLRFVGDENLTIWERIFFLIAFIAALCTTINLINYIYAKWESTPVIIGTDPYPTSISDIPFPAITLCNMNQLMMSKVANYSRNSFERAMIDVSCFSQNFNHEENIPDHYKNNNLSLTKFLIEHAQPCENLLVYCRFRSATRKCSDLFRESVTDEGLCCVFNLLHPNFRYKNEYQVIRDFTHTDNAVPVAWSPETGYQKPLPEHVFYPRPAAGIGVTMGLSLVLNAEVNDYFCSSTNGPGFKMSLHNPMEAPRVRDIGFSIGIGEEVRLRINVQSSSAAPSIRPLTPASRLCLFPDEGYDLTFYKYYTRRNCENECQAHYIYRSCQCIPHNLPTVISNATICGAQKFLCITNAHNTWLRSRDGSCRRKCLTSCFDLTFTANAFCADLADDNYLLQDENILRNMNRSYIRQNIAVVHLFYEEFTFHGNVRTVYVGFTEFLSNTGGILSLFLGFSFISLAEAIYYAFIRPIFWWNRATSTNVKERNQIQNIKRKTRINTDVPKLGKQPFQLKHQYLWRKPIPASLFIKHKKSAIQTNFELKFNKNLTGILEPPLN